MRQLHGNELVATLLVLAGAALVAIAPHLLFGPSLGHSAIFNAPWARHFAAHFVHGDLVPRYLVDYPMGLGAPVFFFYAPAPFLVTTGALLAVPVWTPEDALSFAHWLLFLLSGLACFFWIRSFVGPRWGRTLSVLYMFLPYHYLDVEVRATVGESMAYVWLPLILSCIHRWQRRSGLAVLAGVFYAGLVLSHLPSALLAIPTLGFFALAPCKPEQVPSAVLKLLVVGVVGVLLGAVYLVPALVARRHLLEGSWVGGSGPHFFPENWLLFGDRALPEFGWAVYLSLLFSTGAAAVALLWLRAQAGRRGVEGVENAELPPETRAVVTACMLSVLSGWLLMSDLSRWLWVNVETLRSVQFPWRLGCVIEVCCFTVFAIAARGLRPPGAVPVWAGRSTGSRFWAPLALSVPLLLVDALVPPRPLWGRLGVDRYPGPQEEQRRHERITYDSLCREPVNFLPPEYQTRWMVQSAVYRAESTPAPAPSSDARPSLCHGGYERWVDHVARLPAVRVLGAQPGGGRSVALERLGMSTIGIRAVLDEPGTIQLRRAYFPSWRLRDADSDREIAVRPSTQNGLIEFDLPAGRSRVVLSMRRLPEEWAGSSLSGVTAVVLVGALVRRRLARRGARAAS